MALDEQIFESSKPRKESSLFKVSSPKTRVSRFQKRKKRPSNKQNSKKSGKSMKPQLTRPKTPPRIALGEPGFASLTTAEKLNDPNYRGLVYQSYPNEATCSCTPRNNSTSPLVCPSGCMRSCCMKLRNPKKVIGEQAGKSAQPVKASCVKNMQPTAKPATGDCNTKTCTCTDRLRGGADVEQIFNASTRYPWTEYEDTYSSCGDNVNTQLRLEGGGGGACSCSGGFSTLYDGMSPRDTNMGGFDDPCRPGPRGPGGPTPSCVCLGKGALPVNKTGGAKCSKKPCPGIDCLIRAFKDAQDFVDSLGKVPGLAGLGLMDPTESPFFGRDLDRDYAYQERRAPGQAGTPAGYCEAPCNTQPIPATENISYNNPASTAIPLPGRTGIVREGVPMLPDGGSLMASTRQRRREERREERLLDLVQTAPGDSEVGPCGEPKCKARQVRGHKQLENSMSRELSETRQKLSGINQQKMQSVKGSTHTKLPRIKSSLTKTPSVKSTGKASDRTKKLKSMQGPAGDRALTTKPIKVSKRVMHYIYTLGDVYPGIHYGHKTCIDPRMRVPANMGWLWNTTDTPGQFKPRLGWRPGAIGKYLHEMLRQAKMGAFRAVHRARSTPYSRTKKAKAGKSLSLTALKRLQPMREMGEEPAVEPPTLHIHRKDGTYYVTMYPIKQETDEPVLSEPMKPLQFKIVKNKDDASDATSSTASDMEIEFSPPAALNKNRKKPDVIHEGTQVHQDQILGATKADDGKKKDKKGRKDRDKKITGARHR